MKKLRFFTLILSLIMLLCMLCSCTQEGPQGEQGIQGIQGQQGETGASGKSAYEIWLDEGFESTELDFLNWLKGEQGPSFLTGKGQPSNDLGKIGDSYLDIGSSYEWGFYIKGEDSWELLGYIEAELPPLSLSDLNGTYALSHVLVENDIFELGHNCFGRELTSDLVQVEIKDGQGYFSHKLGQGSATDITYTIEGDKLIMSCKDAVEDYDGGMKYKFEFSIVQDGEIYIVYGTPYGYMYAKKVA
jgi:hypothetical protein